MVNFKNIGDGSEVPLKTWQKLGDKVMINYSLLGDEILSIRYITGSQISNFKKQKINVRLAQAFILLIETKNIDYDVLKQCSIKDIQIFKNVLHYAKLLNTLKFDIKKTKLNAEEAKLRFNILQGELEAGNNSPDIIDELTKHIMPLLLEYNIIPKTTYDELMNELLDFYK